MGRNISAGRKEKELFEFLEAQKAVCPISISLAIIVLDAFLSLIDLSAEKLLFETGAIGCIAFLIWVLCFSFWMEYKILGSDEVQIKILKRMKTLPRRQLFWLMIQANVALILTTALALWLIIF